MFPNFRHSMAWLHTWFGLALGMVLMVVFFFGTLSVFDREIDRWAIPDTRYEPQPMPSFDKMLRPIFEDMQPDAAARAMTAPLADGPLPAHFDTPRSWGAYTTHRDPVLLLFAGYEVPNAKDHETAIWANRTVDPRSGVALPTDRLKVGSEFFYPLHYSLTLDWKNVGYWIVGFSALMMLMALVTGVIMHRKIFRELFTFRPKKSTQRSMLDMHNLTGVAALPFHFFFAFTGLVIFAYIYFPVTHTQLTPLHDRHEMMEAKETGLPHDRAGIPAPLASVDAMVVEAQRRWADKGMAGDVGYLNLTHVGDANGYVSVYRAGTDRVQLTGEGIHFKASTGELLREDPPPTVVARINEFLTGLHLQHFKHWLLRWFYVLGGLAGCACIATGLFFFVEKRKRHHAKAGTKGARVVDALAVTVVTGMLVATLSMLIANRLLPDTMPDGWVPRGLMEKYFFWGAWIVSAGHAWLRTAQVAEGRLAPAWREQCLAIAVLAVVAPVLNWITTGDHLLRTIGAGYWPVAGADLFMLTGSVLAVLAARKLQRKADSPVTVKNTTLEAGHA